MPLYVPLDVDFATDPKFLAAGPVAGYLFICSMALVKRTMVDGFVADEQLPVISIGIPKPDQHAQKLVDVGLWTRVDGGWQIASWLKRNKSKQQIAAEQERKRLAAEKANHVRWHSKQASETCPLCDPNRIEHGYPTEAEAEALSKEEASATVDESAVDAEVERRIADRRRRGHDVGPGLTRLIREDVIAFLSPTAQPRVIAPSETERLEAMCDDLLLQSELVDGESRDALIADAASVRREIAALASAKRVTDLDERKATA